MPQSLRTPVLLQSLRILIWFGGWLIDWVNVACTSFPFFLENHLEFDLPSCFMRRLITRPIGRLDLADFFLGSIDFQSAQTLKQKRGAKILRHIFVLSHLTVYFRYCFFNNSKNINWSWDLREKVTRWNRIRKLQPDHKTSDQPLYNEK